MDNASISGANTGLVICTKCGTVVGVIGGPFHNQVRSDLDRLELLVLRICDKVGVKIVQ